MVDLSVKYLGLKLKNPVVISSCKLTSTLKNIKELESAGAGAVVLKSLFEEQIEADKSAMLSGLDSFVHSDAALFFEQSGIDHLLDQYLTLVEDSKKTISIPVIPSLNAVSKGKWISFAKRLEAVGAPAVEVNIYMIPSDAKKGSAVIEKEYFDILKELRSELSIPVAVKIGSHFSGLAQFISQLSQQLKMEGIVLFNRYYRPDIDIEKMVLSAGPIFSSPTEMAMTLQWIALMSGEVSADLAASTGIFTGADLVKQLLAGAKVGYLCSTLYKNGMEQIGTILSDLTDWMERHHFQTIGQFNGRLCQERSAKPELYERAQYIKALIGIS